MGKNLNSNAVVVATCYGAEGAEKLSTVLKASRASVFANIVVQPAVWVLTESSPDAVDYSLWGGGVFAALIGSGIGGAATAGTSLIKGIVDDETDKKLSLAMASEPQEMAKGIKACYRYSLRAGAGINAQSIASAGGTAWEHPCGIWVYITDARGQLVCDYEPKVAKRIYQPVHPLVPMGDGFKWTVKRGGV